MYVIIIITDIESINEKTSAVVVNTVVAMLSTSLSSFKEGKSETLTITDTDQQTVQENKTHPRMSAFAGLFILMMVTYVAFVLFILERLRAVEALGRYCNSLYHELPLTQIKRHQQIENALVRAVTRILNIPTLLLHLNPFTGYKLNSGYIIK